MPEKRHPHRIKGNITLSGNYSIYIGLPGGENWLPRGVKRKRPENKGLFSGLINNVSAGSYSSSKTTIFSILSP